MRSEYPGSGSVFLKCPQCLSGLLLRSQHAIAPWNSVVLRVSVVKVPAPNAEGISIVPSAFSGRRSVPLSALSVLVVKQPPIRMPKAFLSAL